MNKMSFKCYTLIVLSSVCVNSQDLELGFYKNSCPNAEKTISDFVKEHIPNAPTLASPLLRMHFHDCFVRGCDASVLINSTSNKNVTTEKFAFPNVSLRGFDFIDRIKALLEKECPDVVSCADIIALTARDAVGVIGGPFWKVPTGRRDGLISNASEANLQIPSPFFNFSQLLTSFASKGLNVTDLVFLSGAHTIGMSHCSTIKQRLFNFTGKGDQDPSLDSDYAANLKKHKCKFQNDNTTIIEMDPGSFKTFDVGYYKNVLKRRGLFQSDLALTKNSVTNSMIIDLVNSPIEKFYQGFSLAMEKMGKIEVKTRNEGEIRRECALVNN